MVRGQRSYTSARRPFWLTFYFVAPFNGKVAGKGDHPYPSGPNKGGKFRTESEMPVGNLLVVSGPSV